LLGLAVGAPHVEKAATARQWLYEAIRRGERLLSTDA
jgi:hypothetical protein